MEENLSPDRADQDAASAIARAKAEIKARMYKAARAVGQPVGQTTLVAVSKTQPDDRIEGGLVSGQRIFGENRVQEAQKRWIHRRAAYPDLELHLIGPLQSNKAEEAVGLFDVIETLDRPKLAQALARAMDKLGRRPRLLIQVNTGEEPQKAGVAPADLAAFLKTVRALGLEPEGLMCIPPAEEPAGPHFALLARLAARYGLKTLSMGMSGDFETAIRFGATHIRVGSAFFGARQP
jgi:pyridoxal phosphate enzyme (YggS family)